MYFVQLRFVVLICICRTTISKSLSSANITGVCPIPVIWNSKGFYTGYYSKETLNLDSARAPLGAR